MARLSLSLLDGEEEEIVVEGGDLMEVVPEAELSSHEPEDIESAEVQEIGEISEGLEAIADQINDNARRGTLTPSVAEALNLAMVLAMRGAAGQTSSLLRGHKTNTKLRSIGAESFNRSSSTSAYVAYSIEGIGQTFKDLWNKIVSFCTKWIDKLVDWYNKYLSGAAFAKRRAAALREKAENSKGTTSKDIEIGQQESMNLTLGKEYKPEDAINAGIQYLQKVKIDGAYDQVSQSLDTIKNIDFKEGASGSLGLSSEFNAKSTTIASALSLTKITDDNRFKGKDNEVSYYGRQLPGGKQIVVKFLGEEINYGGETDKATKIMYVGMSASISETTKGAKGARKTKALARNEVVKLCDLCESAASDLIKHKQDYRDVKRNLADFDKEIKSIIKDIDELDTSALNKPAVRLVRRYISGMASTTTTPATVARAAEALTLTAIKSALNVCAKSLGAYKETE